MRIRFIRIAGLTIGGILVAGVALLHTPPAKRYALSKLQSMLAAQGVRLDARGLDFNLLTLQASLNGVVVAPEETLPPLAKLDSVSLRLSLWDLIRGRFVITSGSLQNPEIWVVLAADGRSNLPKTKEETSAGGTMDFLVNQLTATNGSLRVEDRKAGMRIVLPRWNIEVDGDRVSDRHRVEIATQAAGTVTVGNREYTLESLRTVLNAGMEDLRVEELALRAPGASLTGSIAILDFDQYRLDGKAVLDGQPGRFLEETSGDVHAEVTIAGTAKSPVVTGQLQATNAGYQEYRNLDLNGQFGYDGQAQAITATKFKLNAPFGSVNGEGRVSLAATGASRFNGTVQGFQVSKFVPEVASIASGTVQAEWQGLAFETAKGDADIRLRGTRAAAKNVYPVTGRVRARRVAGGTVVTIDRAALSGVVASGTIRIDGRDRLSGQLVASTDNIAAQPYAEIPVSGSANLRLDLGGTVQQPSAAFALNAPNLQAETISGVAVLAAGTVSRAQVDVTRASAQWGEQSLTASGTVGLTGDAAPLALQANVENANIQELLTLAGQAGTPVSGTLNLTANLSGTVDRPVGTASLDATGVSAYGETVGHVSATAQFDKTRAAVPDLLIEKSPNEKVRGQGTYEFETQRFTASVQSDEIKLTRGTVAIDATGSGTVQDPVVTANVKGELPEVGPLQAKAELRGKDLQFTAEAAKQNVTVEGSGKTVAPYPFTVQLQARQTDVASLGEFAPKELEGSITATVNASGQAENWQEASATIQANQLALVYKGQPVRTEGPLQASIQKGSLDLQPVTIVGPGTRLTAEGQAPGALRLNGEVNIETVHALLRPPESPLQTATGTFSLSGVVQSSLRDGRYTLDPQIEMALTNGSFTDPNLTPVTGASLQAKLGDGSLRIASLNAQWAGATISGQGDVPLGILSTTLPFDFRRNTGPANAELAVKGLDFAQIKGVPETTGGVASFTTTISAERPELEAVRGELRMDELRLNAGKFSLAQEGTSRIRLENGTVRVEQFRLTGPESNVTLAGTAQLNGPQALQLRLESNLNLALLSAFTTAARVQGPTAVSVNVGGTIAAPEASGFLEVTNAEASVTSPRVQAESLNVRLDLAKNRVTLSSLSGSLNGGTLRGSGGFSLKGTDIVDADLRVNTDGVYLDFPANLRTMSNANIFLRSSGTRFLLGGNVTVVDGSYTEPVNLDQGLLNVLNSESSPEAPEERSAFLEQLDFGIAIKTENPLVVDNNLAEAELTMDARLTGTYYRPGLVGRVVIDEGGKLNLNEREYLIDRGVLTFTDENRIEPAFDVVAKTQASGYDITLSVQGAGKERETTLTSDPPLPEPDIAAVLLTGRTMEELSGQEGEVAKEQVLSYLTGRVGGSLGRGIERATGLSQVRIEPNLIANESDPSARLTVGQDLTRQLSLIYSMNLTDSGDQIIVGQYDLSKRFRTRALKQSDNSYRFDFSRKQEFGGVPPPPTSTAEREKKKIGIVEFSGERPFSDEQVRKWLSAKQGKNYDFFKIRRGMEKITDKHADEGYLEARIRLNRTNRNGVVDLDLSVNAGPKVDFVFEGYRPGGGTREEIRDRWMHGVFDAQRTEEAIATLRQELVKEGYLQAQIDSSIDTPEPNRKRVIFDIQQGEQFKKPKLVFAGAKGIEESELRDLLEEKKLTLGAFTQSDEAQEWIARYYQDRGFLDAKVAKPEIMLDAATKTGTIVYPIAEGPLYRVSDVRFEGNKAYEAAELRSGVTLETGEPYLPSLREESLLNLQEMYGRSGYNDVELNYTLDRNRDLGRVDVVFQVQEGPQSVVESVQISGNRDTSKNLIRTQLELKPGDPLDSSLLSLSRRNLYTTGAYSLIDIQRNPLTPMGGTKPVALDVNVREIRPFQTTYGGYFDTDRGPGGIVDFSNRNSLGSARVIGVRARYDADLQEGRLYYTQPLLRRFPVRTTGSSFLRREIREGFNTDRIGFSVLQEARIRKQWILNYGYRWENTHTYDRGPDPIFDAKLRVAPFTASLSRDTRDEILDATRGSFLSHAVEYAPTFSGSELNFAKYFGQYFRYFAFDKPELLPMQKGIRKSRLVFATGVRVGLAGGLNGQELIPGRSSTNRVSLGERFFAGGGTTVRGFAQDGVGPRIFDGVSPAGGDALFILNNELRFPIASIFDGVGFIDAGNVYDRINDFKPWEVRKAAGFGIRIRTPYFLIRLDYGFKLDRRPGESLGRPFFSIGQAF